MSKVMKQKLESVFEEPGCAKNQAKETSDRKKGCTKPLNPGAAAGGCAFDGAKITLTPVTDAAHLIHGPISCESNSWDTRNCLSSGPDLYKTSFASDLSETDIITGGEKKLFKAIKQAIAQTNPPAVFVYQTCIPAMIGDDIEAVCRIASEKFDTPVIPVMAPGFAGSKNLGNKLAGEALLDHVIGTQEPDDVTPFDINVIAEYNVSGEFWQVKPLLEAAGFRVRACITGDAKYRDLATAHRAKANMMVCSQAMINVARKMEERYGIPYFEGSFFGMNSTSTAIRTLADLLIGQGAPASLRTQAEALIEREEAKTKAILAPITRRLQGKRILVYTGGHKSWAVVSAVNELGMEVIGTSVRKSTEGDIERVKDILGDDAQMFKQIPAKDMFNLLKAEGADVMMSGGRTQFVALKAKLPWVDINQERTHAYCGYAGLIDLARELDKAIHNPIWAQVRKPAPWEVEEAV